MKRYQKNKIICGCDEAGRGSLAGPVVAGAVILPKQFYHQELNDSKKINKKLRDELSVVIKKESIAFGIGIVNVETIDKINILNASIEAMYKAIESMQKKRANDKIDLLLIDGNRFTKHPTLSHKCIIKGDEKYYSMAAASILAKTYRDELMNQLSSKHPVYNWKNNKGYPTKEHKLKIIKYGTTKYHRKSFKLFDEQYSLKF